MAKRGLWLKLATVPAVITLSLLGLTGSGRASDGVQMNDDCDPTSFNSIGLGEICQGDGETSFTQFITQVSTLGNAPAWNFDPKTLHVQAGEPISLDGLPHSGKGYREAAEIIRAELQRLWRQAAEAVAAGLPPALPDGTRRTGWIRPGYDEPPRRILEAVHPVVGGRAGG